MYDDDQVTFWFLCEDKLSRGQGKRVKGMIKGGMSARVSTNTRIETTIGELKKNIIRVAQNSIDLRYKNVLLTLTKEELVIFLKSPREYTLTYICEILNT